MTKFIDANTPLSSGRYLPKEQLTPEKFINLPHEEYERLMKTSNSQQVDHPPHYQGSTIEVIDIIEDFNLNFCMGNAIKYILRAGKKGEKDQDIAKAIWYLKREMKWL